MYVVVLLDHICTYALYKFIYILTVILMIWDCCHVYMGFHFNKSNRVKTGVDGTLMNRKSIAEVK